jgi:predicted dehydrogenase
MKDLKIGVIGSGGRGILAAQAHLPEENSRIVACCDANPQTLEANRERYGSDIFTTDDYRELLKQDLDAVFIATPDFLHEEMAVAALEAGKAVYLEKPLAITTQGCDRILRTACETKSKLFLGHNMRHMPFVLKMKQLIADGAIGEVKAVWCRHFIGFGGDHYFKDWHAERKYSTGLLLQKAAHDIDIIHWLAGGYSQHINAMGGLTLYHEIENRLPDLGGPRTLDHSSLKKVWPPRSQSGLNANIDVEDISMMQMQLQNGVFAAYQQCHYTPDYWRNYCVIGDAGRLENFGNGEDDTTIHLWNKRVDRWTPADEIIPLDKVEGGHGGADPGIVQTFLRFVREGGETKTSPLAARFSVAAGCAATDSLRDNGTPRDVPDVPPEWWQYFEKDFQS